MTRALRVVVGDDGSDHADAAVAWAADRADEAGGRLRVVRAVSVPVVAGLGWKVDAAYEAGRLLQAVQESGRAHLSHRRRELSAAHPDLEVETAPRDHRVRRRRPGRRPRLVGPEVRLERPPRRREGHRARRHDDALWLAEQSRCPVAVVPCRAT